jgi:hypothetical protein
MATSCQGLQHKPVVKIEKCTKSPNTNVELTPALGQIASTSARAPAHGLNLFCVGHFNKKVASSTL